MAFLRWRGQSLFECLLEPPQEIGEVVGARAGLFLVQSPKECERLGTRGKQGMPPGQSHRGRSYRWDDGREG